MGTFDYNGLSTDKIIALTTMSSSVYATGLKLPTGWRALTGEELGFEEGIFPGGATYEGTQYVGGLGFLFTSAAQIYYNQGSNALTIAFRGTDTDTTTEFVGDLSSYYGFAITNSYLDTFFDLLTVAQGYIDKNSITDINVVGHSLGAAAVNIMRDATDALLGLYGGTFDDANYVTLATPRVADNEGILNIGFENDGVYKILARSSLVGTTDFESTPDNLVLYDAEYSDTNFPGLALDPLDSSAHGSAGYVDAITRISDSYFYDLMSRDSAIIITNVPVPDGHIQTQDKISSTSDHYGKSTFYVGKEKTEGDDNPNSGRDNIEAGQGGGYIDGLGGDDSLSGGGGDDHFFAGGGDDNIHGANGSDIVYFSGNCDEYDFTYEALTHVVHINHVRGDGADGKDTLVDVEFLEFKDFRIGVKEIPDHECPTDGQDIVFVFDTTGSMQDDIDEVLANAEIIIDEIFTPKKAGEELRESRVAMVGYKDPSTETILSFTKHENIADRKKAAIEALGTIKVSGGGPDIVESVYAGLLHALDGSIGDWRDHTEANRIFLFGDAPAKDEELRAQVLKLAQRKDATLVGGAQKKQLDDGATSSTFKLAKHIDGQQEIQTIEIIAIAIGSYQPTYASFRAITSDYDNLVYYAQEPEDVGRVVYDAVKAGTQNADEITTNDEKNQLNGRDGDDILRPKGGVDGIRGGKGADIIIGSFDDLNGDTLLDFDDEDKIIIEGIKFAGELEVIDANIRKSLQIDTDGNGIIDGEIILKDFTNFAKFNAFTVGENTEIQFNYIDQKLNGDKGNNFLTGDGGADKLIDGLGDDQLNGANGHDLIVSFAGQNKLFGGEDSDLLIGGFQADQLNGDSGNDILRGDFEGSLIGGADTLVGGAGDDILMGGKGVDYFQFSPDDGKDIIAGFKQEDINFDAATGHTVSKLFTDFQIGIDQIHLSGFTGITLDNVGTFIRQGDDGAVFTAEGTEFTFYGIDHLSVTSADFLIY